MNGFALTSRPTGVMLLTRRQPFYPSAAHDKFHAICTAFGGYTKFGIAPAVRMQQKLLNRYYLRKYVTNVYCWRG